MNILSLDLGSKTGFSILNGGKIICGTKKLRHDKNASGVRFLDFRNWLVETIKTHNIYVVFFERVYAHKGTAAAQCFGGFMYALAAVCEELSIECIGIPVCTIKKVATGNGHASKKDMIAFAESCGFNPVDDNAADALAVLFVGLNILKNKENFRYCFAWETSGSSTPEAFLASELFRRLTPVDSGSENKE
jgi:Holliday junction resolvasome RuvABC endonuclease subunit